jgi:hypothetical protein
MDAETRLLIWVTAAATACNSLALLVMAVTR